ncbi:mitochondrial substrate carrier family B [Micractinium conductrix]|uniref:Mitochondrial substrate carrier family B n=1 Tax=Micractinium conductrix TaxID=554055 RepID=A0A2P6V611_9CHLO|nr:mitochondrial substrate carrier family B [Micractinium conductrix]|eukprot:PSC69510.1 mitochondrial substrate carrier family B [Micractinium conductrix]
MREPSEGSSVLRAAVGLPVPVRELLAGGAAGATAKTVIAPLERCKILFQTGKLRGAALTPTLTHIYRTEGLPGLWRGNGAAVLRIVPYAASHFFAYEHYRRLLVSAGALGAQEHRVPPVLDLLAGAAAGGTAVLLTYPLDLVRTRLAYSTEAGSAGRTAATAAPAGTLAAAPAATAAAGGSSGGAAPGGGRLLAHHQGRWATGGLALASSRGCASGACSAGGGLPLAGGAGRLAGVLVGGGGGAPSCTNRLQGQGPLGARAMHLLRLPHADPKHTIRGVLASTFQREGVRGLYHGIGASLIGILPYAGLKFYCYQHLKQWYHHTNPHDLSRTGIDGRPRLPVAVMLSFGAAAGLVAQTATYPLDVVRRQMQVEGLKLAEAAADSPTRTLAAGAQQLSLRSTPQALVLLARQHGWRCLFAGLHINYLKVVPSTAIGFTIYDLLKLALHLPTNL